MSPFSQKKTRKYGNGLLTRMGFQLKEVNFMKKIIGWGEFYPKKLSHIHKLPKITYLILKYEMAFIYQIHQNAGFLFYS